MLNSFQHLPSFQAVPTVILRNHDEGISYRVKETTTRLRRSYLTRNDITIVIPSKAKESQKQTEQIVTPSYEAVSKRERERTQAKPSVRVFYLKHENKMYREQQTRLQQAQTDSSCVCLSS